MKQDVIIQKKIIPHDEDKGGTMRLPWGRIVSCFAGNTPPPPTQTPRALEMLMTGYYYDQASHASVSIGNTIR